MKEDFVFFQRFKKDEMDCSLTLNEQDKNS